MKKMARSQESEGPSPAKKPKLLKSKKPNLDTKKKFVKNDKNNANTASDKPVDWKQFKKEKKELRVKRRSNRNRSLIDIITKAKEIGEKIRFKKLAGGTTERTKLINELHELIGNKENYAKFVLAHDMARIVQIMLKYGSSKVRTEISLEIIPSTVLLLKSKYGRAVVQQMMKHGSADVQAKCIKAMYGNAVNLASHAISAHIFEYVYREHASPTDKLYLIQEFFGDMYKHTKDAEVKHLRDVYKNSTDLKAGALSATKAHLSRILNKTLLDSGLVQSVLAQFLSECNDEDRAEMISQLAPHIVVISNSKDGAKVAMHCFWHGTNKDRKVAMKAMKEHVIEMCKHEHAHTAIIALLDSADDTVLMNKTVLNEIASKSEQLIVDDWGRRVLSWIVAPGDTKQFHPQFIKELDEGRANSTCKKEVEVRRKEIIDFSIKPLLTKISEDPKTWCFNAKHFMVTGIILRNEAAIELAGEVFKKLAEFIVDPELKIADGLYIEDPGINMTIKKLVHNDKNIVGTDTFGAAVVSVLNDEIMTTWVNLNRGCFFLADIYANNKQSTQKELKKLLKSHMELIKAQSTKGAEILLEKLA